jgi:hypothetical protein
MKVNITTMIKKACVYHNQQQKCFNQLKLFLVLIQRIKENFMRCGLPSLTVITKLVTAKVVDSHSSPTSKSE